MSKGPGWIERKIAAVMDKEPDNAFTIKELCARIFPGVPVETKHTFSITRAAHTLTKRRGEFQCWRSAAPGRWLVLFRHDEVMSYKSALAKLKLKPKAPPP